MPALNFKEQFTEAVESGLKKQTIRTVRKNPIKVGDTLYLYTGMRTKKCRQLKTVICKKVKRFFLSYGDINVNERLLNYAQALRFIEADGFKYVEMFFKFFGNRFEGVVIYW